MVETSAITQPILIISGFIFLGFLIWLDYKKSQTEKTTRPNIFMRAIIAGFALTLIMLVAIYYSGQEFNYKNLIFLIVVVMLIFIAAWWEYRRSQPLSLKKSKRIALGAAKELADAEPEVGTGTWGHNFPLFKMTESGNKNDPFGALHNWYINTTEGSVIVKLDAFSGIIKEWIMMPPLELKENLFLESHGKAYDEFEKELLEKHTMIPQNDKKETNVA